jgi:hypothetical protein
MRVLVQIAILKMAIVQKVMVKMVIVQKVIVWMAVIFGKARPMAKRESYFASLV